MVMTYEYFLFGSRTVESALGNNFGSKNFFGLHIGNLVAFCETTATQCFTSGVFLYNNLAVCFRHFLLNDHGISIILITSIILRFHYYIFKNNIIDVSIRYYSLITKLIACQFYRILNVTFLTFLKNSTIHTWKIEFSPIWIMYHRGFWNFAFD